MNSVKVFRRFRRIRSSFAHACGLALALAALPAVAAQHFLYGTAAGAVLALCGQVRVNGDPPIGAVLRFDDATTGVDSTGRFLLQRSQSSNGAAPPAGHVLVVSADNARTKAIRVTGAWLASRPAVTVNGASRCRAVDVELRREPRNTIDAIDAS